MSLFHIIYLPSWVQFTYQVFNEVNQLPTFNLGNCHAAIRSNYVGSSPQKQCEGFGRDPQSPKNVRSPTRWAPTSYQWSYNML